MSGAPSHRGGALRVAARLASLLTSLAIALALWAPAAGAATPPASPQLSVTGACLIDADGGQVLFQDNGDAELPIASTTKLMTALITLQHVHDLSQMFTQNDWAPGSQDSQIGLEPGEQMSVHDLLLALLLPSADDAAEDLAYNVGGDSIARFVGMMNAEAQLLGLTHTHYTTPVGLDTTGNYSSPCDLDRLADYDMQTSAFFRRAVALPSAELLSGRYARHIVNTDDLVGRVRWITGIKTGHTADAGYVLVSEGERDGLTLIGSVLGTSSEAARDANALALLGYGFAAFHQVTPVSAGQVLARRPENDLPGRSAAVIAARSFSGVMPIADSVRVAVSVPRQLAGPLRRHAIVGEATVLVDGRATATIPLEVAVAVPAVSTLTQVARFLTRPSTLVLLALALAAAGAVAGNQRRRPRVTATGRLEEG
jgi:D-alanyl-D-alanine carboxypeptidase (penicillin-binding protein 5/6)